MSGSNGQEADTISKMDNYRCPEQLRLLCPRSRILQQLGTATCKLLVEQSRQTWAPSQSATVLSEVQREAQRPVVVLI